MGFVVWELHQPAPLLDVRLFRKRGLASGSVSLIAVFGVPTGVFVVLYPYFQVVLGWSGLVSTLALMPMLVLMIACSVLAPRLTARIGTRLTMATGISWAELDWPSWRSSSQSKRSSRRRCRNCTQRHSRRSCYRPRRPPLLESFAPVRTGVIRPRLAASNVGRGCRDDDRACLRSRSWTRAHNH